MGISVLSSLRCDRFNQSRAFVIIALVKPRDHCQSWGPRFAAFESSRIETKKLLNWVMLLVKKWLLGRDLLRMRGSRADVRRQGQLHPRDRRSLTGTSFERYPSEVFALNEAFDVSRLWRECRGLKREWRLTLSVVRLLMRARPLTVQVRLSPYRRSAETIDAGPAVDGGGEE